MVLIRLFDSDGGYSAESRNPDPDALPGWDDDAVVRRRRPTSLEMLDNTESDPPVLWDLRFYTDAMVDHKAFARRICSRTLGLLRLPPMRLAPRMIAESESSVEPAPGYRPTR